jgi:hypothetical protein
MALGCQGADGDSVANGDDITTVRGALNGTTTANLQLQVSKNACAGNVAQNYFKVTNATTAAVPLSQIAIKYWVNDTTLPATNITPQVWYGGCVTSANGTCVHQMTGVTASAVRFSPACGPDATHQANWEITISTTDTTSLAPGQTWSGVQTAVTLANWARFSPGSSTWFSGCGNLQPYAADTHFAVYLNTDLVTGGGAQPPSCRAPVPPAPPAGP